MYSYLNTIIIDYRPLDVLRNDDLKYVNDVNEEDRDRTVLIVFNPLLMVRYRVDNHLLQDDTNHQMLSCH